MEKYIRAKDLAVELMKHPNDVIAVTTENFEQGQAEILRRSGELHRFKGEIVEETFRDAFDGETYTSKVVKRKEGGKLNFVKI